MVNVIGTGHRLPCRIHLMNQFRWHWMKPGIPVGQCPLLKVQKLRLWRPYMMKLTVWKSYFSHTIYIIKCIDMCEMCYIDWLFSSVLANIWIWNKSCHKERDMRTLKTIKWIYTHTQFISDDESRNGIQPQNDFPWKSHVESTKPAEIR